MILYKVKNIITPIIILLHLFINYCYCVFIKNNLYLYMNYY